MKLTEPPCATVSTSISPNAAIVSDEAARGAILIGGMVSAPGEGNDVHARC